MRIYYKKKFWAGVGALLLGLALPGTCLFVGWERFDLKDAVLTMFMVLSGISGILRSLGWAPLPSTVPWGGSRRRPTGWEARSGWTWTGTRTGTSAPGTTRTAAGPSRSGCCFA